MFRFGNISTKYKQYIHSQPFFSPVSSGWHISYIAFTVHSNILKLGTSLYMLYIQTQLHHTCIASKFISRVSKRMHIVGLSIQTNHNHYYYIITDNHNADTGGRVGMLDSLSMTGLIFSFPELDALDGSGSVPFWAFSFWMCLNIRSTSSCGILSQTKLPWR